MKVTKLLFQLLRALASNKGPPREKNPHRNHSFTSSERSDESEKVTRDDVELDFEEAVRDFIVGQGGNERNESAEEIRFLPVRDDQKGVDAVKAIAAALRNDNVCTCLRILHIEGAYPGQQGLEDLFKALSQPAARNIHTLSLIRCKIDDRGALKIANFLRGNQSIKELHLCQNRLGDQSATAILEALQFSSRQFERPSLRRLYMQGNRIRDVETIASALKMHVDVASLQPYPQGDPRNPRLSFGEALVEALTELEVSSDDTEMYGETFAGDNGIRYDPVLVRSMEKVIPRMRAVIPDMENVNEMRLFYTIVRNLGRMGLVDRDTQKDLIKIALEKARKIADEHGNYGDDESELMLLLIWRKIMSDGLAVNDLFGADNVFGAFSMDITIKLYFRVRNLEHSLSNTYYQLAGEVDRVSSSLEKLRGALRHKLRVESIVRTVSCILNLASFGVLGSVVEGVANATLDQIIDFGDIQHIQGVAESTEAAGSISLKQLVNAGLAEAQRIADRPLRQAVMVENQQEAIVNVVAAAEWMNQNYGNDDDPSNVEGHSEYNETTTFSTIDAHKLVSLLKGNFYVRAKKQKDKEKVQHQRLSHDSVAGMSSAANASSATSGSVNAQRLSSLLLEHFDIIPREAQQSTIGRGTPSIMDIRILTEFLEERLEVRPRRPPEIPEVIYTKNPQDGCSQSVKTV